MFYQLQDLIDRAISVYGNTYLEPFLQLSDTATFALIAALTAFLVATLRMSKLLPGKSVVWAKAIRYCFGHLLFGGAMLALFTFTAMFSVAHAQLAEWNPQFWAYAFRTLEAKSDVFLYSSLAGLMLGTMAWFWIGRRLEPKLQQFVDRRTHQAHEGLIDVRQINSHLPTVLSFKPETFFQKAGKQNALFLGMDENKKTALIPRAAYVKSNIQLVAPPGRGKGVCAGVVLSQCIQNFDDAVVVMDPKNDEWAPSVLAHACRLAGRPFQLLDLRQGMPPQFNPLQGTSSHELYELLVASFGLGRKGTEADYYRLGDRRIARRLSDTAEEGDTFVSLYFKAKELAGDDGDGFLKQFEELASLSCATTKHGFELETVIKNGGCVYVIGSMRDETVMQMQRLVFVRILQLIEARRRGGRHVSIFADEWKYLVSAPVINALGTVRDKGCNILIAHQSLGDLRQVGQDLDPEAAANNVIDNTPLKWIYRPSSFDVAEWASKQAGNIVVQQKSRLTRLNDEGAEIADFDTVTRDTLQPKYDTNILLNLPEACALCVGAGPARLAFARPILVNRVEPTLFVAEPAPGLTEAGTLTDDPWGAA
ncbi:type IV secretory system conjugative DNA transfer family protein [Kordiimonas sp.]|uniref:type IV secretory system conjugative DNA transfer family protein n=1 Tax=Kordiimonas sp. TaxID=1970157 RepID=UPI003A9233BA